MNRSEYIGAKSAIRSIILELYSTSTESLAMATYLMSGDFPYVRPNNLHRVNQQITATMTSVETFSVYTF